MNTGIQDAMNLGWKLASALRGGPDLLDTYQSERHPVGESVLKLTDAAYKLVLSGSEAGAAIRRFLIRVLLKLPRVRKAIAERLSGVGIHYGSARWEGGRMPDYETGQEAGRSRVYEVLRSGEFAEFEGKDGLPPHVLVRPDGYIAWAGADLDELAAARRKWCRATV
jgi:hypothetical protein